MSTGFVSLRCFLMDRLLEKQFLPIVFLAEKRLGRKHLLSQSRILFRYMKSEGITAQSAMLYHLMKMIPEQLFTKFERSVFLAGRSFFCAQKLLYEKINYVLI